jgi:hypothetical protein
MLPRILSRDVIERQTKSGGALFYTVVDAEFDLVSALDGSTHTIRTVGEAMDSADKSSNKAMSAAYKYAAMQAFCIPTEGDNDADAVTHEVASAPRRTATITDEQRSLMAALIPAAGKTVQDIVEAYGVSSIAELSEAKAAAAIARLKSLAKEPA